ncbi:SH3 domain-containing protein [Candidatus Thiodiazotropha sp. LNASS1]|uniref:SH3 domain-containing protein n=1 Tax=Candidatus Thiodiazotropha sp. LNASS1 TaxID=3096260 RepID=UPI0034DF5FF4
MKIEDLLEPQALKSIRRIQEQMDSLRRATEPTRELRKQIEAISKASDLHMQSYQSSITRISEAWAKDVQPAIEAIRKLNQRLSPFDETIKQINRRMEPYSEALRQIRELSERVSIQLQPLAFADAYELVTERYTELSQSGVSQPAEALTNEIEEKIETAYEHPLSLEFYLNLLIALFIFILSQVSSIESEEDILSQINELQELVVSNTSVLNEAENEEIFYVVTNGVNLRKGPSTSHEILTVLHPNMKVRFLERESKWLRIECFDYLSETTREGWAHEDYLKMLKQ